MTVVFIWPLSNFILDLVHTYTASLKNASFSGYFGHTKSVLGHWTPFMVKLFLWMGKTVSVLQHQRVHAILSLFDVKLCTVSMLFAWGHFCDDEGCQNTVAVQTCLYAHIHTVTADLFKGKEALDITATFNTHSLTCPPRDPAANLSSFDKTWLVGQLWKQPGSPRGNFFGLPLTVTVLEKAFCILRLMKLFFETTCVDGI